MSETSAADNIQMIPIASIRVLNPRVRNRQTHQELVDSIELVGLKRPITVCQTNAEGEIDGYDLVCGQGRIEAFVMLEQEEIPAIVTNANERECLIKSLVENIARRQNRPIEYLENIGILRHRGYSNAEIGRKIGCSGEWVKDVTNLLDRGEKRLLAAAEAGHIPMTLAVEIARSPDTDCQALLMDAYNRGELKGKKIAIVRRILDVRAVSGRSGAHKPEERHRTKTYKPEELRQIYETEANKHKLIIKRAEFAQGSILSVIEAFKDLLRVEEFTQLLSDGQLDSMPEFLKLAVAGVDGRES